ncbi:MAG: restriction endonuclease subunit S [Rhizobiales bacterium]|nr:restriction endonuclease subunit S [Hyphomicrobiales bacterium]OJX98921.1 MAG: hypothetical protein BGP07_13165 [Rhizobiales bacterium 63-22]
MSVQVARLGDIVDDLRSGFACGVDDPDGVIQFRMNNVERDGTLNWTKTRRVPQSMVKNGLTLQDADILLNATNSPDLVGKTALFGGADEPITFSNHFLRLRTKTEIADPAYVSRWLRRQFELGNFKAMCRSWVNQASITRDQVSNLKIPLPPLDEQKRIAAILDKADQLRQKRRQAIALLDSLTQSIFVDMFGRADPAYPTVKLSEITHRITDGVHQKPTYTESGIPFISVKDITTGKLIFDACKFISEEDHKKYTKRCKPEKGDILYTKVGATYGRPAIIDTDVGFSIYVSVALIKPNHSRIRPKFLKTLMATDLVRQQANRCIKGIGVPDLHLDQIQSFQVPLPPMAEQVEFEKIVDNLELHSSLCSRSLQELDATFSSLQHRAFSGQL